MNARTRDYSSKPVLSARGLHVRHLSKSGADKCNSKMKSDYERRIFPVKQMVNGLQSKIEEFEEYTKDYRKKTKKGKDGLIEHSSLFRDYWIYKHTGQANRKLREYLVALDNIQNTKKNYQIQLEKMNRMLKCMAEWMKENEVKPGHFGIFKGKSMAYTVSFPNLKSLPPFVKRGRKNVVKIYQQ